MKARFLRRILAAAGGIGVLLYAVGGIAQEGAYGYMAPVLSSGAAEIMKLSQAKVSDDTIIAYIRNAEKSFYLNADQILYLRQQGVSETVITAMLNKPATGEVPVETPPEA